MSRQSENSAAGSAGDAESMLSSLENSPRKATEPGAAGPCGDFSPDYLSCVILKMDDALFSSDDDDEESCELKMEYLHRLKLIRERLATIDIANKSYYNNCFGYPPQDSNPCRISEITEDDDNVEMTKDEDIYKENIPVDDGTCTDDTFNKQDMENTSSKTSRNSPDNNNHFIHRNSIDFKSTTTINLDQDSEDSLPLSSATKQHYDLPKQCEESKIEVRSSFSFSSLFNKYESSPIELLDLNYNPPKKKTCVRETTPKLVLSEGAMPLPYHIRVSLHDDISKAAKQPPNEDNRRTTVKVKETYYKEEIKEEWKQDDCRGGQQVKDNGNFSDNSQLNVAEKSPRKSTGKDNLYVLFLDTLTQSSSASPKSNKTVITDTTATIESPSRLPKKRRIYLRSARNKVKPIDSLTLWEEIRTMEAISKRKRVESSSSKESYFKNILLDKVAKDEEVISAMSLRSLDIPRKSSLICKKSIKFPSITKITQFCSSAFGRKSDKFVEDQIESAEFQNGEAEKVSARKVANTLLNLKQEQNLNVDSDNYTPSGELHSEFEYTESDEDIDANYQPFCLFCFCF